MKWQATLLLFVAVSVAHPCGVCVTLRGDPFALPHPRAIEIALATRAALDKGILPSAPVGAAGGWNRQESTSDQTFRQAWSDKAKGSVGAAEPWSVHIVLIDTSQSLIVHFRSSAVVVEAGSLGRDHAALATTQTALQALLSGRLDWTRAVETKLVVIDGKCEQLRRLFETRK